MSGNAKDLDRKNPDTSDEQDDDDDFREDPWEKMSFQAAQDDDAKVKAKAPEGAKAAAAVADPEKAPEPVKQAEAAKPPEAAKIDAPKAGEPQKAADSALDKLPKLEGDDLKRAKYLQETLGNLTPIYTELKFTTEEQENLKPQEKAERVRKAVEDLRAELAKEKEAGVFGPATQKAYEQYTNWLQKAVPATIKELDSLQLSLPAGSPIELETNRYGRAMDPQLYKALANDNRLALELKVQPGSIPSEAQLDKLDAAFAWLAKSNESVADYRNKQRDDNIETLLRSNGLPREWQKQPGDDPTSWRNSAEEMIDLSVRTRNYIEAMQSLFKASKDRDFPLELPRGAQIVVEDKSGKTHVIKDNQLNDYQSRYLLKEGKIREVKLDLPKDLRQEEPANKEKITRLRNWLDKNGEQIDKALAKLKELDKNPDAVIMYGDQEVKNGKALFNEKGEFLRVVKADYPKKPGEEIKDMNLIGYDFQVEQIKEGKDAGKFRITQTIQAENAPWYAYQNIRALGIEKVGKPMKLDEKIIDADDFVPVRNGEKIELVKAKNLQSFKDMQKLHYYGEKTLAITMDVAMVATGSIEVAGAIRGARIAATAVQLTAREAGWTAAKGLVRVGVGGSGLFSNAGARDHEWGRTLNTARGIYFLGDIGLGLASSGWRAVKAGKAVEAMTTAEKVHTVIRGREAVGGVEAIKGIPWVKEVHKGTEFAFKASEYGFAPIIIGDLKTQIAGIQDHGKLDPTKAARIQVGDGRGLQTAEKGAFDPKNPKSLDATRLVMDSYKDTLARGRKPESAAEIKAIMDKAKELLGPESTQEARDAFKKELLSKLVFTADQVQALEKAHPESGSSKTFRLSDENLHDLLDPEKRKTFPKKVAELADKFMSEKDKDVQAAARIALLYLSRDADGKITKDIAQTSVTVPEYKRTVTTYSGGDSQSEEVKIEARSSGQKLQSAEIISDMLKDLASTDLGNRGIVTGEILTRIEALEHQQYAGVLQNVLNSEKASREDKLQALADTYGPRMASVIDGVRYQESQPKDDSSKVKTDREIGRAHGLNSEALLKQLEKTAKEDKDPDVRALSAALLYGLREKQQARRAELLSGFNTMLEQNRQTPGALSNKVQDFLKKEMRTEIPEGPPALAEAIRESRFNAALSMASLTAPGDAAAQLEITKLIAGSFSSSNFELSTKIIDALMPDRMAELQKADPQYANQLRIAAIDLIKKPDSLPQEKEMIKLLTKLEPFLRGGEQEIKQQLQQKLQGLLRNSEVNQNYAKYYPALRAAAIDTLADLGSRESLEIIMSHASAQPSINVGKTQPLKAGETDAGVRYAAVRAMEKLADPNLRIVVNELVDKETDPSVAAALRDIQFKQIRIEPSSKEWEKLYTQARIDLIGLGKEYDYLNQFTAEECKNWLNANYPLLEREKYLNRLQAASDGATNAAERTFYSDTYLRDEEWKAAHKENHDRWKEWEALVKKASEGGVEGNKAKMALFYIATQNGSVLGNNPGNDKVTSKTDENKPHGFVENKWNDLAAWELRKLAESNCEGKIVVKKIVKDALTVNQGVSGMANMQFLEAWRALGKKDSNGFAVSREELAQVTAQALNLEIRRLPAAQSDDFQKAMIADLNKYGHRLVLPVMQAITEEKEHSKEGVRKEAQKLIDTFMHSTKMMYDETKPPQTATPIDRANRLKAALADANNAETTVQEIFNAYKDYKITDAKDPGLTQLQIAMNDQNERVRLAASRILMNSELPNNHPVKMKAIATLTDMTLRGSNPLYHSEAYEMLAPLKLEPGKPLLFASGNKFFSVEKEGEQLKIMEYTKEGAQGNPQLSGVVSAGGDSMAWKMNAKGDLTNVWKNGESWQRKMDGEKATDEWSDPNSGAKFKGDFKLPDAEKVRQDENRSAHLLESGLAQAKNSQEKIKAIQDSCQTPPISNERDRRLAKVTELLKDQDEMVRMEAANVILKGSKDNLANKAFKLEQIEAAYQVLRENRENLIKRGVIGNDPASLAILDRALDSPESGAIKSALANIVQNQEVGADKASQLLMKHLGQERLLEIVPGGAMRETRSTADGIIISEKRDGKLSRLTKPPGLNYAELLTKDLAASTHPQEKLALAKTILEAKVEIGRSSEHSNAALKELSSLSGENKLSAPERFEAAKAFLASTKADQEGADKVYRALAELSGNPEIKSEVKEFIKSLKKEDAIKTALSLKNLIISGSGDQASRFEYAHSLLQQYKAEPAAEAAAYELYAKAKISNAEDYVEKFSKLVDRSSPDHGLSPLGGKNDPRLAVMSKIIESDIFDDAHLSAAFALIDKDSKEVPKIAADNARKHLHKEISSELERLKNPDAMVKKPTDADWAKLDMVMEKIGQSKDDYARLYIESKRLELKQDLKGLADVYEKLAAVSKERDSEVAEKLYAQKAKDYRQMVDPEIQTKLEQLRASMKDVEAAQKAGKDTTAAQAKIEKAMEDFAAKTGKDSSLLAQTYLELAAHYKSLGAEDKAILASMQANITLDEIARAKVSHFGATLNGTEGKAGKRRLAVLPYEGSSGESTSLGDNSTLGDSLDYQFSKAAVGIDASKDARRLSGQLLSAQEAVFGKDSPQTNAARENYADVLLASGDANTAERFYKASLESPGVFGAERGRLTNKVAQSLMNKGPQGQIEALQLMETSLTKMRNEGADPMTVANQMDQYARLAATRGDQMKAQDFATRAQQLRETGKLNPPTTGGHYSQYPGGFPGAPPTGGQPGGPNG
ncbi:MAG: HEAT repeat domain-containing protein [Candidatus Obscuribacterales bacterium]|nr:HEAT repeat domain-containing protein [Candidatus Obscuribacterales bacterium]